jgi:hypothetical protein
MTATLDDLLIALNEQSKQIAYIVGVLENAKGINIKTITIKKTLYPISNPTIRIPDGMSLVIKADDGNAGTLTIVSKRDVSNKWSLAASEYASLRIDNLDDLQITGDTVGDIISFLVEAKF